MTKSRKRALHPGHTPIGPNPAPTSIRLPQEQIDFLRAEAVKRGYFSYKYPEMGAVSTMIADLVNQFQVFVHGQPKKPKKKITLK